MIVAFLGPSLPRPPRGFQVLPPARQGDVWRALDLRPRAIALIDGVFESQPSVWHHEILDALDAGVPVFGGASMGALRAAELHGFGMAGVGQIFEWYRDGVLIDDADVALLHGAAEHGFVPLTVPQVNVRWAAQEAVRAQVLTRREADALVRHSADIFYQDRTWPAALAGLPRAAQEKWKRFRVPDLKADDAVKVLRAALAAGPARTPRPRHPPPSSLVRLRRGIHTPLLAGWARDLGLRATDAERAQVQVPRGLAPDLELRMRDDLALERLVREHSARMINDGTPQPTADQTGAGSGPRPGSRSPRKATRRRR